MKYKTLVLTGALFLMFASILVGQHDGPWLKYQIVAIAIMIPSFLLWGLARHQLGDSFSVQARATALVTHGLYSKIRNPVYLFGGLFIAGFLVFLGHPYLLLVFLVLVPMQMVRARNEERVLTEAFPDTYPAYKRGTWF